ncbi:MAG: ABC transporter permease [Verrucomicrobiota bacterium]|nr:ABC transporter permease [Verrucomicrobiota bacterium]
MKTVILRRILLLLPMLLAISFLSFALMSKSPGNYLDTLKLNPQMSQAKIDKMTVEFGLDKKWYVRYGLWLRNAAKLNFGESFHYKQPVWDVITARAWNTFILSSVSLVLTWGIAIPLGVLAAINRGSLFDKVTSFLAFMSLSFPNLFLALLALFFAYITGWLPVGGMRSVDHELMTSGEQFFDILHHLVLPVFVLCFSGVAGLMRLMRGTFLENMRADYVTTARAKGMPEGQVMFKHVLRNAINPMVTLFGFSVAGLLSGAVIVENVLGFPGLGQLALEAFFAKDEFLVMASILMASFLLIMGNLLADILLVAVDPRIRYE